MKKTYRNAVRSRQLIRQAFLELLQEKPLEKITVVDVTARADLSRNTFYTHYQDIYAILEEFRDEALDAMSAALEDTFQRPMDEALPLLLQAAAYVEAHQDAYRVLLASVPTADFIDRLKALLLERVSGQSSRAGLRDPEGFQILLQFLASGFVDLTAAWLQGRSELSPQQIARQTFRIYLSALPLYR